VANEQQPITNSPLSGVNGEFEQQTSNAQTDTETEYDFGNELLQVGEEVVDATGLTPDQTKRLYTEDDFQAFYDRFVTQIGAYLNDQLKFQAEGATTTEDLVQIVFLKVLGAFRRGVPLGTSDLSHQRWMYRIAKNVYIDHYRRLHLIHWLRLASPDAKGKAPGENFVDPSTISPEDEVITRVLTLDALRNMPRRYAEALIMYHHGGYTYEQIAEQLNTAPSGVKMFLSRARVSFRNAMNGFPAEEDDPLSA